MQPTESPQNSNNADNTSPTSGGPPDQNDYTQSPGDFSSRPSGQPAGDTNISSSSFPPAPAAPNDSSTGESNSYRDAPELAAAPAVNSDRPASPNQMPSFPQTSGSALSPQTDQYFAPDTSSRFATGGAAEYPFRVKKPFYKRPLGWALVAGVVLLAGGGYIFGVYLPNTPENAYKTGITRTGIAAEKLTIAGTEKSKLDEVKNSEFSGKVTVEGPSGKQSGTFSSRYDDEQTDSKVTYSPDGTPADLSAQIMTDLTEGEDYPDTYFKVNGLKALGLDQMMPSVAPYEDKWIHISPAYIQSLIASGDMNAEEKQADLTQEDAAELARTVVATTREYVFTNDPTKNVLVQKSFKGKEKLDGNREAYRYEMGLHKAHAKDYCAALITNVMKTKAYARIPGVPTENLEEEKKKAVKGCQDSIESDLKDSDTFDMWVDKKTKLISKVRVTGKKDKNIYLELGHTYDGGDSLPMFLVYYNGKDKSDAKLTLNSDLKTNITTGTMTFNYGENDKKWNIDVDLTFKPYARDVTITKPKDAVPIDQLLTALGFDSGTGTQSTPAAAAPASTVSVRSKSQDTERQTDLKAIQGQLEAYYTRQGMYPWLSELNSASWRSGYMRSLDEAALADPTSGMTWLLKTATSTQYGYAPQGCAPASEEWSDCKSYTLTAMLSSGTLFTLKSLN